MSNSKKDGKRVGFGIALSITALWAIGVLFVLGYVIDMWSAPNFLIEWLPEKPSKQALSLGETGDFLTGWLTPLALTWFVITVFLQRKELALQRKEFEKMREEYSQSREAAVEQAQPLKSSNKVRERQVFIEIVKDSLLMSDRHSYLIIKSLSEYMLRKFNNKSIRPDEGKALRQCYCVLEQIDENGKLPQTAKKIEDTGNENDTYYMDFVIHLQQLSKRHSYLSAEATNVGLERYYEGICAYRMEGEIMVLSARIINRLPDHLLRTQAG
jgi:hypothetical protein